MTASLLLTVDAGPGALIRVLGMAERRGYDPISVNSQPTTESTLSVQLTVRAERPVDLLLRRLQKLYNVRHVEVLS